MRDNDYTPRPSRLLLIASRRICFRSLRRDTPSSRWLPLYGSRDDVGRTPLQTVFLADPYSPQLMNRTYATDLSVPKCMFLS